MKIFLKRDSTGRFARVAAPFPPTLRAGTRFPAAYGVPQPAMPNACRAKLASFFSTLFFYLFSLAANFPSLIGLYQDVPATFSREDRAHPQRPTRSLNRFNRGIFYELLRFRKLKLGHVPRSSVPIVLGGRQRCFAPVLSYSRNNFHSQCLLVKVPLLSPQQTPSKRSLIK